MVELLVAMVASVLVIGATLSMTSQHAKLRRADRERNLALVACRNNLEELRSVPFTSLPAMDGVGFDVPGSTGAPGGLEPLPGDADGLPGQFSVTVDQASGGSILYLVRATVTWSGSLGEQTFELETLIGERE